MYGGGERERGGRGERLRGGGGRRGKEGGEKGEEEKEREARRRRRKGEEGEDQYPRASKEKQVSLQPPAVSSQVQTYFNISMTFPLNELGSSL